MRDGQILADATPHGLLEETGTLDVEDAFLAVIARNPSSTAQERS